MTNKLYITAVLIIVILSASITAYALDNTGSASSGVAVSSSITQTSPLKQHNKSQAGEMITVIGAIECLIPVNTNGTQIESCALGVTEGNGTSYGLDDQDPTAIGSLPTGQQVKITGALSQQTSQYKTTGVINVSSVDRL